MLSIEERHRLGIGPDFAAVWTAPTTTPRDRKELLGTLIEEAVVKVERDKSAAHLMLRWKGGALGSGACLARGEQPCAPMRTRSRSCTAWQSTTPTL